MSDGFWTPEQEKILRDLKAGFPGEVSPQSDMVTSTGAMSHTPALWVGFAFAAVSLVGDLVVARAGGNWGRGLLMWGTPMVGGLICIVVVTWMGWFHEYEPYNDADAVSARRRTATFLAIVAALGIANAIVAIPAASTMPASAQSVVTVTALIVMASGLATIALLVLSIARGRRAQTRPG